MQACFLELLRPDCHYDAKQAPLRTWLFGVVRNQSLKRLRQRAAPHVAPIDEAPSPEHEILRVEIEEVVRRAVLMLPELQREVLILAHFWRVRVTVWMAPALNCFALRATVEAQQADGSWTLESEKKALRVTMNR